jgi:hypothetical protein
LFFVSKLHLAATFKSFTNDPFFPLMLCINHFILRINATSINSLSKNGTRPSIPHAVNFCSHANSHTCVIYLIYVRFLRGILLRLALCGNTNILKVHLLLHPTIPFWYPLIWSLSPLTTGVEALMVVIIRF